LTLLLGGSIAEAGKKEKIAILGLEVFSGSNNNVDAESTRVAKELSDGLRTRPKTGQGPYQIAPDSEKELIDEKLMNTCENEEVKCMTTIARNLKTDYLMWGKIEKKSLGAQTGYQISLKLLRVSNQTVTNWTDFMPLADANGGKLQDWARKGYKKLTNDTSDGTLVIKTNVDRATILLDNEEKGNIVNNRGEVLGLADGKYRLAIEAKGYQRWEADEPITIRGGETTTQEATLKILKDPDGKIVLCDPAVSTCENTTPDHPSTLKWKILMGAGLVVAGIGTYEVVHAKSKIDEAELNLCSGSHDMAHDPTCMQMGNQVDFKNQGDKYQTISYVGAGIIVVGGTVAVIGLVKGFIATGKEKQAAGSTTVGKAQPKQSNLAITPIIGPQGAGATLRFDW